MMPNQRLTAERRDLWYMRLYYLFWYGGPAFTFPFFTLFLLGIGLSGIQVGTVSAASSAIALFAAPFWAARYDRWKKPAQTMRVMLFLLAAIYLILSQQVAFAGVLIFVMLQALVGAGLYPISDVVALKVTTAAEAGFGSVRVFGSLSWVIFVLVSGQMVERFGLNFSLIGGGFAILTCMFLLSRLRPMNFVRQQPTAPSDDTEGMVEVNSASGGSSANPSALRGLLHSLTSQPLFMGLAALIFVVYMANSGVMQFQGRYLNELGASDSLISVAGMLSALVELPCMIWADHLLKKRDPYHLLLLSMLLYTAIRVMVLVFPGIGTIMLANAITGVSYSFLTVCLMHIIADNSAPRETRSLLAFYNVTLISLTSILGAPLAGIFFDQFGTRGLYAVGAVGFILGFAIMFVARRYARRHPIPAPQTAG